MSAGAVALALAAPAAAGPLESPATQEVGGGLGFAIGGRTSPGGLEVGGDYLYRLSQTDWLESRATFTFGSGAPGCFRDRGDARICQHDVVDGFAAEAAVAVRRYLPGQGPWAPFARVGVGLRLVSFSGDEVRGLSIPALVGGGVRAQVNDDLALVGGGDLRLGYAWFNRGVAGEPQLALSIVAAAELALD